MTVERSERDKEFDERWEKAKRVKIKRPEGAKKTSVFTIKMDRDLLHLLVERARELGVGPSTLARGLIEGGLLSDGSRLSDEAFIEAMLIRLKEIRDRSRFVAEAATGIFESVGEALDTIAIQDPETSESADTYESKRNIA